MKKIRGRVMMLAGVLVAIMMLTTVSFAQGTDTSCPYVPTMSGDDLSTTIDVSVGLFQNNGSGPTPGAPDIVIEDDAILMDPIYLEHWDNIALQISWSVEPTAPVIKGGDYFKIPLPIFFDPQNIIHECHGYTIAYDTEDKTILGYWAVQEDAGEKNIVFIAHENFSTKIEERGGFFDFISKVIWNETTTSVDVTIADKTVTGTINKPSSGLDRFESDGYPEGEDTTPENLPYVTKSTTGSITVGADGNVGTAVWRVNVGHDIFYDTAALNQDDVYDTRKNIVIRDELFQEGQTFNAISITLPIFTPLNINREFTTSVRYLNRRMSSAGFAFLNQEASETVEQWEERISHPDNAPAYGFSTDRKIAIVNMGNPLDGNAMYAENNADLEAVIRDHEYYTDDEVKTIMQSIGLNTDSYTLTNYDGTTETIAINNFANGRIFAFDFDFKVNLELVNGREYSNQVDIFYNDADSETVLSEDMIVLALADGGAVGVPTGLLYLYKNTEESYNTADEVRLEGAVFDLYLLEGEEETFVTSQTTNELGSVLFENMAVGRYRMYESSTVDGYSTSSLVLYKRNEAGEYVPYSDDATGNNWFEFEVTAEDRYFYFEATNKESDNGTISLTKTDVDAPTVTLAGAEFTLTGTNSEGTFISTYDATNEVYTFSKLPHGIYTIEETRAPLGYNIDSFTGITDIDLVTEGIQIEVNTNSVISLAATNKESDSGTIALTKTDVDAPTVTLTGAEFRLVGTKSEGTYTSTYDATNKIYTFTNLPYGIYTIEETKAPLGYSIDSFSGITDVVLVTEGIQIEINSNDVLILVATNEANNDEIVAPAPEVENSNGASGQSQVNYSVPDTSDNTSMNISLIMMIIAAASIVYLVMMGQYKKQY